MFDSHAHPGIVTERAFVASASASAYEMLKAYKYKAIGTLTLSGKDPDFPLLEKAVSEGFSIGEIGLDKRYGSIEKQEEIFIRALEIAKEHNAFVVIHTVRMYQRTLEILRMMGIKRFMMHGFTGSPEMAQAFIAKGGIISLSPRAENTKHFRALLHLPFVTETDMNTGAEEERVLYEWNEKLSGITGSDIASRTEEMMGDALNG